MTSVHTYDLEQFCQDEFRRPFAATELGGIVSVLPVLSPGVWIAGGAVRRFVMDEPLGDDIDVFFNNQELFSQLSRGMQTVYGFAEQETSRRHIYNIGASHRPIKIDLVREATFPDIQHLFSDFDLTCCQFGISCGFLYAGPYAMLHAAQRILMVANEQKLRRFPQHAMRYLRQGFRGSPRVIDAITNEILEDSKALLRASDYSGQ